MNWLAALGIVGFVFGLLVSIALHEVGHLLPAKAFGVKVTQYMVGFGRTLWSRRRGETEYGVKAIPFGGYVRMIGMFPPEPGADPRQLRRASTGPFQALVEDARQAVKEEIKPGDEGRVFYAKPWWQKLIVMLGGPAMNVVLAAGLFAVVISGFGVATPVPVVAQVPDCVIPADEPTRTCRSDDPVAPAAAAGLQPGDRIVEFDGVAVTSWEQLTRQIRESGGKSVQLVVERAGREQLLTTTLVSTERPDLDDPNRTVTVGFLGVVPESELKPQPISEVPGTMWNFTTLTTQAVLKIPQKMVGVWNAAFGGEERDPNGPIGVVGASRIGGEVASSSELVLKEKVAGFLGLLASFNLAIAIFNLIPLLPLDGGHAAGAIWEGIKRGWARLFRRPPPRPVDVARALPLAYGAAAILIGMSVLLLYADLVNPVRLGG